MKGNTSLYLFNTVLAAFVIGILLEPLRAKVEAQVVHIFFRERSELLRSLGGAADPAGQRHRLPERPPRSSSTRWRRRGA